MGCVPQDFRKHIYVQCEAEYVSKPNYIPAVSIWKGLQFYRESTFDWQYFFTHLNSMSLFSVIQMTAECLLVNMEAVSVTN